MRPMEYKQCLLHHNTSVNSFMYLILYEIILNQEYFYDTWFLITQLN